MVNTTIHPLYFLAFLVCVLLLIVFIKWANSKAKRFEKRLRKDQSQPNPLLVYCSQCKTNHLYSNPCEHLMKRNRFSQKPQTEPSQPVTDNGIVSRPKRPEAPEPGEAKHFCTWEALSYGPFHGFEAAIDMVCFEWDGKYWIAGYNERSKQPDSDWSTVNLCPVCGGMP